MRTGISADTFSADALTACVRAARGARRHDKNQKDDVFRYGSSTSLQYLLSAAMSSTKLRNVTGLRR